MPQIEVAVTKPLSEVVYDVRSPHVSVPNPDCERHGQSGLWGLYQRYQSNDQISTASGRYWRVLLALHPHLRRDGLRRGLRSIDCCRSISYDQVVHEEIDRVE